MRRVVVDPRGWFLPFGAWVKFGRTASEWLTTMRGVTSIDQQDAATCMAIRADSTSIPCLVSWLSDHPGGVLTIVVPPTRRPVSSPKWLKWIPSVSESSVLRQPPPDDSKPPLTGRPCGSAPITPTLRRVSMIG